MRADEREVLNSPRSGFVERQVDEDGRLTVIREQDIGSMFPVSDECIRRWMNKSGTAEVQAFVSYLRRKPFCFDIFDLEGQKKRREEDEYR